MADRQAPAVSYGSSEAELALPEIALVAVKLLGLYALLSFIPYVSYFPLPWRELPSGSSRSETSTYAISGLCYLAAGIFLLTASRWVVARVMGVRGGVVPSTPATEHFQAMTFAFAGLVFLVNGIAGVIAWVAYAVELESLRKQGEVVEELGFYNFAAPLVELVSGLLLFLRGRGLAALWHRMRYGGVRVRPAE